MRAPFALTVDSGGDQFTVTGAAPRLSWKISPEAPRRVGHELEALIDGVPAGSRAATLDQPPVRRVAVGRTAQRRSESSGASARSRRRRRRSGRTGPRSRWVCSTRTGRHPGSRPSSQPTPGTASDPRTCSPPNSTLTERRAFGAALRDRARRLHRRPSTASASGPRNSRPARPRTTAPSTRRRPMSPTLLRAGVNRLEIELSDGWYRGQVGAFRMPAGWGTTLGARVELHIEHADGTRQIIRSDENWTSRRSTIVRADLMDGQTVDFAAGEGDPIAGARGRGRRSGDRLVAGAARAGHRVSGRRSRSARSTTGVWVARLRAERLGLDPADGPRPGRDAHHDRLRRARRRRRRPDHRSSRLRATRRTADDLRAAR